MMEHPYFWMYMLTVIDEDTKRGARIPRVSVICAVTVMDVGGQSMEKLLWKL